MTSSRPLSRRQLIQGIGSLSAVGVLAACGSKSSDAGASGGSSTTSAAPSDTTAQSTSSATSAAGSSSGVTAAGALPSYVQFPGPKPYYQAANQYEVNGFLTYPSPAAEAVSGTPGKGGTVTVQIATQAGTPKPMGSNNWWKAVNERIGAKLEMAMTPAPQYSAKISTLLAGGDLPDLVRFNYNPNDVDGVLKAKFAGLNEYLAGDNIKDYPCLANIPSLAWKTVIYNDVVYGVPMPVLPIFANLVGRADLLAEAKVDPNVGSADEFMALCQAVTDPKKERWAWCRTLVEGYIAEMFGAPANWKVEGDKFVKDIETDGYTGALAFMNKMWKAGVMYPDTFSGGGNKPALFQSGRSCLYEMGGTSFVTAYNDLSLAMMAPPRAEGGGLAAKALGSGVYGFTAINQKTSKDRIKEFLGILNLLAAPFGTAEYLLPNYGAKGVDYTIDPKTGDPKATAAAKAEKIPVNYLPGGPSQMVFFSGGNDAVTKAACEYQAKVSKNVAIDPTVGLYSRTYSGKSTSLNTAIYAAEADVITGRKSVSDWKDVVATWRRNGGDQSRAEYEQAYAAAH